MQQINELNFGKKIIKGYFKWNLEKNKIIERLYDSS